MTIPQLMRAILFTAILIGINAGLSRAYFWAETPSSWTLATDAQLAARGPLDVEWLILGDSHAKCGIDPRLLPDAFNLATLGSHYYHSYYRLKHFLEREGGSARFVILPMDTHSVAWQRARMEDGAYWSRYISYPQMAWRTGEYPNYARQFLTDFLLPYAGHGDRIVEAALERGRAQTPFPLIDGHIQMPGDWSATPEEERLALTAQRCAFIHNRYDLPDPVMTQYLLDTLALCARHGVRPVMVRFPLTHEAWDEVHANMDLAALDALYDKWFAPYPGLIRIDLGESLGDRLELFNDPDHLNAEGARVFTELLVEALAEKIPALESGKPSAQAMPSHHGLTPPHHPVWASRPRLAFEQTA